MAKKKTTQKKKTSLPTKDKIRKAKIEECVKYIARSTARLCKIARLGAPYTILKNDVDLSYARMLTLLQEYDRQEFVEIVELNKLMVNLGLGKF